MVSGREEMLLLVLVMGQTMQCTKLQGACLDMLCKAQQVPVNLIHGNTNRMVAAQCNRLLCK